MAKRTRSAARKKKRPARSRRKSSRSSTGSGVFLPFHERCPEIAERETRTIMLFQEERGVPAGEYGFVDTFCEDRACDCRRAIFLVFRRESDGSSVDHVLTIGYGWEPLSFYRRWMGDLDFARDMKGPAIEPFGPPCAYGHALLDLFGELCLSSPKYVARIRRHYELFRKAL